MFYGRRHHDRNATRSSAKRLALAADALLCLRFYTRLPIPTLPFEPTGSSGPFSVVLRLAPLAGVVVGLATAAILYGAAAVNLPSLVVAALALLAAVLVTGGLHEDGLADCADGFGGGSTRARKLEIMRDSRLGSYGALAIGFSLLLRAGALSGLLDRGGVAVACAAAIAAAAASRGFGLLPLAVLGPARPDGVSHSAGRMPARDVPQLLPSAAVIGTVLPVMAGIGFESRRARRSSGGVRQRPPRRVWRNARSAVIRATSPAQPSRSARSVFCSDSSSHRASVDQRDARRVVALR